MPLHAPHPELEAAAALYGVTAADLEELGAFESDVYAFAGPHGPSILKVIEPAHRNVEQVQAEVDWLLALRAAGVAVAEPLPSSTGAWVETLDHGAQVLVAFQRAPGRTTKPEDWTESRIADWGSLLGQLQAHSRSYEPPGPRRRALAGNSYLVRLSEAVPDDPAFVAAAAELAARGAPLLGEEGDSGLIHADLHHGNLLLNGDRWTAIDFDDAAYGPYAFDLAMPLYYCVRAQKDTPADEAADTFLRPFLRGLREHAPLPETNADQMDLFLRHRDAELVVALRTKLTAEQWSDSLRETETRLRRNVAAGRAVVGLEALQRWFE